MGNFSIVFKNSLQNKKQLTKLY